jgi:hypothetical protein
MAFTKVALLRMFNTLGAFVGQIFFKNHANLFTKGHQKTFLQGKFSFLKGRFSYIKERNA